MTEPGMARPLGGGAPAPDPERVAAIRAAIADDAAASAGFAEPARAALASLNDHTLARARDGALNECEALLEQILSRVSALDPARLEPRGGLAGLFDSRGKRLKAMRDAFGRAASACGAAADDLATRSGSLAARDAALDNLWSDTRDAITELDAHIAAGRAWLADRPSEAEAPAPEPEAVSPEPAPNDSDPPAQTAEAETSISALRHPMQTRLDALDALRAVAIARLPLIRASQNADCRVPGGLKAVCDGVEAWRATWGDALGLAGRKPKKVRPDPRRLAEAQAAITQTIQVAERELDGARRRRSEIDDRLPASTRALMAA